MAEPSRYTPEQLSILLRIAAGKLGRDPVKLQEELQNGRLDGLLQSLGADREKVNALLSDREGLSQLLQSPQVRMLLQQLLAGQPLQKSKICRCVLQFHGPADIPRQHDGVLGFDQFAPVALQPLHIAVPPRKNIHGFGSAQ